MRSIPKGGLVVLAFVDALVPGVSSGAHDKVAIEFRIRQNMELILFSDYGEPPQFAVWLEDPAKRRFRTVFVTRRSGTGTWEGKVECPAALPRWFEIHRKETGRKGLPTPKAPAPDGVSGATPKSERFNCDVEVEAGGRWICWIEVNISADFNETFRLYNETTGMMDTDHCGQPSLLYRAEVTANAGTTVVPQLWGYAKPGSRTGEIERNLEPITTAKDIFQAIEIRVVRPKGK